MVDGDEKATRNKTMTVSGYSWANRQGHKLATDISFDVTVNDKSYVLQVTALVDDGAGKLTPAELSVGDFKGLIRVLGMVLE